MVYAVVTQAAHSRLCMLGALKMWVFARVAHQAGFIDLGHGELRKLANFGYIPASVNVRFARTVAAFASNSFAAMFKGNAGVRIGREFLRGLLVARGAGF